MKKQLRIILSIAREEWHVLAIGVLVIALAILRGVAFSDALQSDPTEFQEEQVAGSAHTLVIDDLQRFRINGQESSSDWLVRQSELQFSATGFLFRSMTEAGGYGVNYPSFYSFLFIPERVSGTTIYHVIPFQESEDTVYSFLDPDSRKETIKDSMITRANRSLPPDSDSVIRPSVSEYRLARLEFSIHKGWQIHADYIGEYWNLTYRYAGYSDFFSRPDYYPFHMDFFDLAAASRALVNRNLEGDFWLDVSDDESFELSGVYIGRDYVQIDRNSSVEYPHHLPDGKHVRAYVLVLVGFNTASIVHAVPIYFLDQTGEQFFEEIDAMRLGDGADIAISVIAQDGALVFSGHE